MVECYICGDKAKVMCSKCGKEICKVHTTYARNMGNELVPACSSCAKIMKKNYNIVGVIGLVIFGIVMLVLWQTGVF